MPSAKAILIQTVAIVGVGAVVGLGDLLYRGDGVKLKADAAEPLKPVATPPGGTANQQTSKPANGDGETGQQESADPQSSDAANGDAQGGPENGGAVEPDPVEPTLASVDCEALEAPAGWPASHITVALAQQYFATGQAVFVDARIEEEYVAGHIPQAHWLPVSAFESGFPDRVVNGQMDPGAITIVYCSGSEDCEAAEDVTIELQAAGFTRVYILHDGMPGWVECGHPQEAGEDPNAL